MVQAIGEPMILSIKTETPIINCCNCGAPYSLDEEGSTPDFCTLKCEDEALQHLHEQNEFYSDWEFIS